jgi:hypothetical protein
MLLRRVRVNMASQALIPRHSVFRNEFSRDTGQRASILVHPGLSGTGGNPIFQVPILLIAY